MGRATKLWYPHLQGSWKSPRFFPLPHQANTANLDSHGNQSDYESFQGLKSIIKTLLYHNAFTPVLVLWSLRHTTIPYHYSRNSLHYSQWLFLEFSVLGVGDMTPSTCRYRGFAGWSYTCTNVNKEVHCKVSQESVQSVNQNQVRS